MKRKTKHFQKFKVRNLVGSKKAQILGVKIPLFMLLLLAITGLSSVFLAIEISTSGAELAKLESESARLKREKEILTVDLVKASSLSSLGERAEEMGFVKPERVLYIGEAETVAKLP